MVWPYLCWKISRPEHHSSPRWLHSRQHPAMIRPMNHGHVHWIFMGKQRESMRAWNFMPIMILLMILNTILSYMGKYGGFYYSTYYIYILYIWKLNECNLNGKRDDHLEFRLALPCPNSPNQLKVCGLYCDTGSFTKKKQKAEHLPLWFMPFMTSMIRYAVSMWQVLLNVPFWVYWTSPKIGAI